MTSNDCGDHVDNSVFRNQGSKGDSKTTDSGDAVQSFLNKVTNDVACLVDIRAGTRQIQGPSLLRDGNATIDSNTNQQGQFFNRKISHIDLKSRTPSPSFQVDDSSVTVYEETVSEWSEQATNCDEVTTDERKDTESEAQSMIQDLVEKAKEDASPDRPIYVVVNFIVNNGNLTLNQTSRVCQTSDSATQT